MKKTVIILSILALLASGCKPKTTSANLPTTSLQADTLNISQAEPPQETDKEKELRYQKEKQQNIDEFNAHPLVSAEEVARIAPVIKKWTNFYNIDFAKARLVYVDTTCFNCTPTLETQGVHYREFGEEEDTNKRIDVDYSPDKQRYVDLQAFGGYEKREDGKYDFMGWEDGWEIYLIDRKQKHQNPILWVGGGFCAEAVFWKSNDVFMIVGHNYGEGYSVWVFDIAKETKTCYQIMIETENAEYGRYMDKVYWKEKGVIVVN